MSSTEQFRAVVSSVARAEALTRARRSSGELHTWRSSDINADSWSPLTKAQYTQPLNAKRPTICGITTIEYCKPVPPRWPGTVWSRGWREGS